MSRYTTSQRAAARECHARLAVSADTGLIDTGRHECESAGARACVPHCRREQHLGDLGDQKRDGALIHRPSPFVGDALEHFRICHGRPQHQVFGLGHVQGFAAAMHFTNSTL